MKNYFSWLFGGLFLLLFSFACSKSNEPEPDAAALMVGEYKVTEMTANGLTATEAMIAQANGTVKITIIRKESYRINMRFYANIGGQITDEQSDILVEKSGNAVLLKDATKQIGKYQDRKLEFSGTNVRGESFNVKAIRQ